jgi:hypothetical protein
VLSLTRHVSSHYAIVVASGSEFQLHTRHLDGANHNEPGPVLFLVEMPLVSTQPTPKLPNPLRPLEAPLPSPEPHTAREETLSILETYGITPDFLGGLRGKVVAKYPPFDSPIDYCRNTLVSALKTSGSVAGPEGATKDVLILMNHKFAKSVRHAILRAAVSAHTELYTVGPSLRLPPSEWRLKRIWARGGIVTFSPTFILQSPSEFEGIMATLRTSDSWFAYVTPSTAEWIEQSVAVPE